MVCPNLEFSLSEYEGNWKHLQIEAQEKQKKKKKN